jgi:tartrate dehydratase alpha subunit/fumarate hydratase class I-like protein
MNQTDDHLGRAAPKVAEAEVRKGLGAALLANINQVGVGAAGGTVGAGLTVAAAKIKRMIHKPAAPAKPEPAGKHARPED